MPRLAPVIRMFLLGFTASLGLDVGFFDQANPFADFAGHKSFELGGRHHHGLDTDTSQFVLGVFGLEGLAHGGIEFVDHILGHTRGPQQCKPGGDVKAGHAFGQ